MTENARMFGTSNERREFVCEPAQFQEQPAAETVARQAALIALGVAEKWEARSIIDVEGGLSLVLLGEFSSDTLVTVRHHRVIVVPQAPAAMFAPNVLRLDLGAAVVGAELRVTLWRKPPEGAWMVPVVRGQAFYHQWSAHQ